MGRDWKPGSMARTKAGGTVARTDVGTWVLLDDGHRIDLIDRINDLRPLVVIDPEDRGQVERLLAVMESTGGPVVRVHAPRGDIIDVLQAALRDYADPKPPEPEEPTGLGAVVRDGDGYEWVVDVNGRWWCASREANRTRRFGWWPDIPRPLTVLSPGWDGS